MADKKRLTGPDIVRCIAIILVLTIHSINYSGQINCDLGSLKWGVYAFFYFLSKVCIPLFLLLTGYFQSGRTLSRKHYISIIPVLVSYFVILIPTLLINHRGEGILRRILYLFDFEAGYSWYVEMYLCLFALIPFLNILYHALSKRQKQLLIGILVVLTVLPPMTKSFMAAGSPLSPIPDFLESMYVITYYYIGTYIAEYQPRPKPWLCMSAAAVMLLAETALYFTVAQSADRWRYTYSYASLPHAFIGLCIFLAFYRKEAIKSRPVGWLVREISLCSFEMYLLSCPIDYLVYRFLPAPWGMPVVFALSFLFAKLLRLGLVPLSGWLKKKCAKGASA